MPEALGVPQIRPLEQLSNAYAINTPWQSKMVRIEDLSSALTRGIDGIWYAGSEASISYPEDGHQNCFAIEDRSFWFRHRNACIVALVRRFPPGHNEPIFDIGGGNGFVSLGLARAGFDVVLIEPGRTGARNAKQRGVETVVCATAASAGLRAGSISSAGLFDVVEHIADDVGILQSMREMLRPGGRIYLTVPAYSWLWSDADVEAGHYRRYTRRQIISVLLQAGLEIEYCTCIFRWLPLPILALRALPYRLRLRKVGRHASAEREHAAPAGIVARLLAYFDQREIRNIELGRSMRFGGSHVVVARKPKS